MRKYDAFLSYNNQDVHTATYLAVQLIRFDIRCWLAQWNLTPGEQWQERSSKALEDSGSCVVIIGPNGLGDWQKIEIQLALEQQIKSKNTFRLIPVYIPGGKKRWDGYKGREDETRLINFLQPYTWVDFQNDLDESEPLRHLVAGVRGFEPGPALSEMAPIVLKDEEIPYKGLDFFEEKDAGYYFGRERLTQRLLEKIEGLVDSDNVRFLAVIGPSGSGKSSLMRAGLSYQLHHGIIGSNDVWPTLLLVPGIDPVRNLAIALGSRVDQNASGNKIDRIEVGLLNDPDTLELQILDIIRAVKSDKFVLFIDQFEEIYTRCKDNTKRNAFIENVLRCASPDHKFVVVISMRADFYHNCFENKRLADIISDNQVAISPMDRSELAMTIEKPAAIAQCRFEAGLVDRLISDMEESYIGLPLLEHVLLELWWRREGARLTHDTYEAIGGIAGALEKHAESVFNKFNNNEALICKRIFMRLVQPVEGASDAKRRALINELIPPSSAEPALKVLQSLTSPSARLIIMNGSVIAEGTGYAEIIHESLITNWPRLRSWIDEDREGFRILHRLINASREWLEHSKNGSFLYQGVHLTEALNWASENSDKLDQDELLFLQRSTRRKNLIKASIIAGLCAVFVSSLVAFYYARHERNLRIAIKRNSDDLKLNQLHQELSDVWLDPKRMSEWLEKAEEFAEPIDRQAGIDDELDNRLRSFRYGNDGDFAKTTDCIRKIKNIRLETIEKIKEKWDEVISEISSDPIYGNLQIEPIEGLVPIGKDNSSHFYEFAHYLSGEIPTRDQNGILVINDKSAIVFVLLPGGEFKMGTKKLAEQEVSKTEDYILVKRFIDKNKNEPIYSGAENIEAPVTLINLSPFLISKYELTQGQWERLTYLKPSVFPDTGLSPVDDVNWREAKSGLEKVGLTLPTEAQWEYSARSGTTTNWWTGNDKKRAIEAGMISKLGPQGELIRISERTLDVNLGEPNYFGIYGVIGNVWEWCLDQDCHYEVKPNDKTGQRECETKQYSFRGGSYWSTADFARASFRRSYSPEVRQPNIGIRAARSLNQ